MYTWVVGIRIEMNSILIIVFTFSNYNELLEFIKMHFVSYYLKFICIYCYINNNKNKNNSTKENNNNKDKNN